MTASDGREMCMIAIQENIRLSTISTLGIGGPADYFCEVSTLQEVMAALHFARERSIPYFILGRGSNCLFHDEGLRGLVIRMKCDHFASDGKGLYEVGAGFSFAQLGRITAQEGYHGLEFASGIPATVGGAVFMNAGASGQETKDYLTYVDLLEENGAIRRYTKDEMAFSYRTSPFQKMKNTVIVQAGFQLDPSTTARKDQKAIVEYRLKTQPYKDKSAGCIFRNPGKGISSGRLIEEAGLKGAHVGGAEVSSMHANFIVNRDRATCRDIISLIEIVQKRVCDTTGHMLECEIRIIDQYGSFVPFHELQP